jgi:hypothetical protein
LDVPWRILRAAAQSVDARARRHVELHQGTSYKEAVNVVLKADKQLAEAYAAPASRRARTATPADARSSPAVPVTPADEAEIRDWVMRAITDDKAGSLPGALGSLAVEADAFKKLGMPVEEATRRAMGAHPHLVSMAKLLLADVRRNAPELVPTGEDKPAQGSPAGFAVHARAVALMQEHPELDYRAAVGAALSEDPVLKTAYARS